MMHDLLPLCPTASVLTLACPADMCGCSSPGAFPGPPAPQAPLQKGKYLCLPSWHTLAPLQPALQPAHLSWEAAALLAHSRALSSESEQACSSESLPSLSVAVSGASRLLPTLSPSLPAQSAASSQPSFTGSSSAGRLHCCCSLQATQKLVTGFSNLQQDMPGLCKDQAAQVLAWLA